MTLRPSDRSVIRFDHAAQRIQPDDPGLEEWNRRYLDHARHRLLQDMALLEKHVPPGARILELGSAPPYLTAAISELYDVTGIDIDPARYSNSIADLQLDIRRSDFETEGLPVEAGSFDIALVNEVFEHLRINPLHTLREVRKALRRGGTLMLCTPNLRSYRGIWNFLVHGRAMTIGARPEREFLKLDTVGHMGHVREYTPVEVIDVLHACGFSPKEVVYRGKIEHPLARWITRIVPSLHPYFSLIATRQ